MKRNTFKKILRGCGIGFGAIILIIILFVVSLRFGFMQNFLKDKAITYLQDKIKTPVSLEKIYIGFPNSIELKNLYLKGQKEDTLLYAKSLQVNLDMWALMNSKADITAIDLDGINTHIVRNQDGSFNFDYIINAFAADEKEEKKDSKPFVLSLDKIDLKDIRISFTDLQAKNDVKVYFKNFSTRIQQFDIENNAYGIGDLILDGLRLNLKQDLVTEVAEKVEEKVDSLNQKKPMQLDLNGIKLSDFQVNYNDENTKTFAQVVFDELSTKINQLDLTKNSFDIQHITLKKANIDARLFLTQNQEDKKSTQPQKESTSPFLKLRKLKFDDVQIRYSNQAVQPIASGMDFNHLNFSKLNLQLNDFVMDKGEFTGKINSAEIIENKGLNIQKLHTDFAYKNKEAYLKNLLLQTPSTTLREELRLSYENIGQLTSNLGEVHLAAHLPNAKVGFRDVLLFAPNIRNTAPFNHYPNAELQLNSRIIGKINDLTINDFQASGIGNLKVALSGKIKNATNPNTLSYDLRIRNLSSSSKTLEHLLPPKTLPNSIALPTNFALSGNAKGTTKEVYANLNLTSTDGNATLLAQVDMRRKNAEIYTINADLDRLNIGKIIKNKDLGIVSGKLSAKGQNFDVMNGIATLDGQIKTFDYNQYRYQNVLLNGHIRKGAYDLKINSKDDNAKLNLYASGTLKKENPTATIDATINKLDLHKLNFYKEPMAISGNIRGNFSNLNPDALNGHLTIEQFAIADGKEIFPLQPIDIHAISTDEKNQINIHSQITDIDMVGKFRLTQIFGSLQHTLNQYYQFQKKSSLPKITEGQYFTLEAKIKNDDLIRKFVPELKHFETIGIAGSYNADNQSIALETHIPQVDFSNNTIEQGTLKIDNQNEALQYALSVEKISTESVNLNKIDLSGNIANDVISYRLSTKDDKNVEQFLVAGNAQKKGDDTQISLDSDGLKLHYDRWLVAPDNRLQFGKSGILAENFVLSNAGSEIAINSEKPQPNSPLRIDIKDFKIEYITEIIKKDSLLAKGNINGSVQLKNLQKQMTFDAGIDISSLEIYGSPIGNLDIKAKNTSESVIDTNLELDGNGNSVQLSGNYNTTAQRFDMDLNIHQLQMKSVQGFSANAIQDAEGFLSGKLAINGTAKAPQIIGKIDFNDVGMLITQTGSNFRNINDAILFQQDGLKFNQFKLKDTHGNALVLDGNIETKTYQDFNFNLSLKADDFKVVDAEEDQEKMMYGVLAIDANLKIKGSLDLPKVDGTLGITETTDFTFVLPQSSPSLKAREGIVEFIDQDNIELNETLTNEVDANSSIKGMNVNVNIALSKEAKMSILIDKANGDFVKLQGEAELTGGIDPSGKTTLVGVYQVEKGAYEMSLSMLKRRFEIEKGSTITWTGEPTTAKLNLKAIYKTNAAPLDLLQQQLTSEQINYYKQRIPFNTELKLSGELMKPIIGFDITVDDEVSTISREVLDNTKTKLEQLRMDEAEMNKQVFALLSLGRFVGENPFQSNSGQSTGTMLRQSVSQILSQQLNNLASDLIAGVDLSFDLNSYEDYSTGNKNNRTDLNVNLSKNLLDDRLKVTVGSNFGVEGNARQNEQMSNIAGNISLDYLVSKDGKYKLRAYRKNDYQVALQGQIIETGVGFILTLDYDTFKQILLKGKQNKEIKRLEKNTTK